MAKFPGIKVEKREAMGRKVKKLRRQGIIPANLFGHQITSIAIQVDEKSFLKTYKDVGETGIVEVLLGEDKYPSLIVGQAVDPVTNQLLHVDFHNVSLKEKVTATIPVHIIGESPAVKDQGGVMNQSLHEVEVEALPTNLPEAIEVDVTKLINIGDSISISDLKISSDVELKAEPDTIVLSIAAPAKEEVVEVAPAEEVPVVGTTTESDSAAPVEGEAKSE